MGGYDMMMTFSFRISNNKIGHWDIMMLVEPTTEDLTYVCSKLAENGCREDDLKKAVEPIIRGYTDSGFTHSNKESKRSITAIINSSSTEELMNTLSHEIRHIERHICDAYDIDPYSEDAAYLAGVLSEAVYPHFKQEICRCE